MISKSILLVFFLKTIVFASCHICICTESSSSSMSNDYIQTQIVFLKQSIIPDIQEAIDKAKIVLEKSKKSNAKTLAQEALLKNITTEEEKIIHELKVIFEKKKNSVIAEINLIKAELLQSEIYLKEANDE